MALLEADHPVACPMTGRTLADHDLLKLVMMATGASASTRFDSVTAPSGVKRAMEHEIASISRHRVFRKSGEIDQTIQISLMACG